jgi:hypothetical protein
VLPISAQQACEVGVTLTAERRKERRYIVVGIAATADGQACSIVDISPTAVRLVRPGGVPLARTYTVVFAIEGGSLRTYTVPATLIRNTETCFVLKYDPPVASWEDILRAMDTFEQTRLIDVFD